MKKLTTTLLGVAVALGAMARPAKPGPVVITEADGTEQTVYMHGDEFFHYMTDEQGRWVEMQNGKLAEVPTLTDEEIVARRERGVQQVAPRRVAAQTATATPLNLAPRGLVILANFSDVKFSDDNNLAGMTEMFDGENYTYAGATGSAKKYFSDQSYGQYVPQFDIVGPVDLPQTQKYYGQNTGYNGGDANAAQMIIEACQIADTAFNIDFTKYDNNNDKEIDFVYVVYAGRGEADSGESNTIWPHTSWISYTKKVYLDGKQLNTYACSNELRAAIGGNIRDGIGAFCHEFSHVLGLPDLYNTTGSYSTKLMGDWDIMDSGSYNNNSRTPSGYSAQERFFLGWQTPTLLYSGESVVLEPMSEDGGACIITETGECNMKGNDPNPTTYYLLENRQLTGWDKYLPGHGLLITKINYSYNRWVGNTVNNSSKNLGVDIIEADGLTASKYYEGKQGDSFPYEDVDYFTPYDVYPITRIRENEDGTVSFDFMGGSDVISAIALDKAPEIYEDENYNEVVGVYDAAGRLVKTEKPFNDLAPGMYVVGVSNGKKTKGVKIAVSR